MLLTKSYSVPSMSDRVVLLSRGVSISMKPAIPLCIDWIITAAQRASRGNDIAPFIALSFVAFLVNGDGSLL